MDVDTLHAACEEVRKSIGEAVQKCCDDDSDLQPIGGVCITLSDDFSWAGLTAISKSRMDEMEPEDRWDVHSWMNGYPDVNTDPLNNALGEPEIEEPDDVDACGHWLAGLVRAMQLWSGESGSGVEGAAPYLFCTMTDSEEGLWFENLSAKSLTDAKVFDEFASEVAEAHGCEGESPLSFGNAKFQAAFAKALEAIS